MISNIQTNGCVTYSDKSAQLAAIDVLENGAESCLPVQLLPTRDPRDVPAAQPGLEASSKATLKSLHDLTDPTSGILSLVPTNTAACYSSVGLHSPRALLVRSRVQSGDTLRLAPSEKAINVQSTAATDTLHPSPTVVSIPPSHYPGLADSVVFKASRVGLNARPVGTPELKERSAI